MIFSVELFMGNLKTRDQQTALCSAIFWYLKRSIWIVGGIIISIPAIIPNCEHILKTLCFLPLNRVVDEIQYDVSLGSVADLELKEVLGHTPRQVNLHLMEAKLSHLKKKRPTLQATASRQPQSCTCDPFPPHFCCARCFAVYSWA